MIFKNVTVAGGGVLGSQIAMQCACYGHNVTIYSHSEDSINRTKESIQRIIKLYKQDLKSTKQCIEQALSRVTFETDLAKSVEKADLVIEALPEDPKIKTEFYKSLAKVAPQKTVFATNTSTLLPSQFAEFTGRAEKFLALHFANKIWLNNTAEIMGHSKTDKKVFDEVVQFAKEIGMVALPLYKEQPGYILNSLLVPFLSAGAKLRANEVSDPKTIDKTRMVATGAPMGPFAIFDMVGIRTAYNVNKMELDKTNDPLSKKITEKFKMMIDEGRLGIESGKGFYDYPNPEFEQKNFTKQ